VPTEKSRSQSFLLIFGDSEGFAWVLEHERMAFTSERYGLASEVEPGSELLLYTSRGCFGNPTRDRGRVVGLAQARSTLTAKRLHIGGRRFDFVQDLSITGVCARGDGVDLASRVSSMRTFPSATSWSAHLRKPLLRLDPVDADRLREEVAPLLRRIEEATLEYRHLAARHRQRRVAV
jgi:hypothetical protein